MTNAVWKLGVDVGGTFTDAVLYNEETGEIYRAKVPSTPQDQSVGVLDAVEVIKSQVPNGQDLDIAVLNHGTTVATNAILEGKGAHVALLVTEGYKDILQVRRSQVPGGLAGWIVWPKPTPLAPLELTIEVPGRIATDGTEVRPLDGVLLRERLAPLKASLPESITVSLINSFANPAHERAVADILHDELPGVPLSLSSDILPEIMEYERTVTTVANAYVKPTLEKYLGSLQERLGRTELRVLRSDGGLASVAVAKEHCASLLYSGPAGGVTGVVSQVAGKTMFKNLLTFDMGGTSTDVCLIESGIPQLRRESTVGDLTIRAPSIDVRTVGAGGGSLAAVASITGALRVGPDSAGASPGPACYCKGGTRPTVTDAFATLGYLPQTLAGGLKIDYDVARTAVQTHVAEPMGMSVEEAAEGILRIAIEKMYGSLRSVSVEKGKDPRSFHLVAFGGAGALVACELARLCQTAQPTIVPPSPGVLCAFGDASTALRHEVSVTVLRKLADLSVESIFKLCGELRDKAALVLEEQGVVAALQKQFWEADCRFKGQATNLPVSFTLQDIVTDGTSVLEQRFKDAHTTLFTYALDLDVEVVNLRAVVEEKVKEVVTPSLQTGNGTPSESTTHNGKTHTDVPIYDRALLRVGNRLQGPCIITEDDSNTLVTPFHYAEIDAAGNILIYSETSTALDYFPLLAAGRGKNAGKMVCGQFGSFINGFLASWDETIEEGDVFLTNDPYSVSNSISHLNDFLVINPVHYQGELIGWTANLGHFTDLGSAVPGSMPNCAQTIFEDGIQIPLCKLYSAGNPNKAVFKIVERNSRKPDFAKSDLHALVAATKIGSRRIIEMCDRFGADNYCAALDELLERNKTAIRKLIKTTVPYEPIFFEDYIDDDGFGLGPWRIACKMTKIPDPDEGEIVMFDFDGTDPQSDRSINFALSHEMLKMFIVIYLLTVFDPQTVYNDGGFDLIKINIPLGTILNPIRPAALSCRTHLLARLFDVIGALIGQRQPEFLSAAGFSDSPHFFYSGWTRTGEWFQLYQIGFGGIPARPHGDGPDGHSLWPSMRSVPNEFLESYLPLRVDRYETIPDSGGPGFYRGGNAMRIDYTFLEPGLISIHDDRSVASTVHWFTKPWGVHGGGTGARSSKILVKYSKDVKNPPHVLVASKEDDIPVQPGDVLIWKTWGGGGWGSPLERDPWLVAKEVRQGLVRGAARYGVVLTSSGSVDGPATKVLRTEMAPTQAKVQEESLFNRGGSLDELAVKCLDETGFPSPSPPSTRILRGPVAQLPHILELHERRAQEDAKLFGPALLHG
ncbi:Hydantoinase/oxoprolinase-domain-containing protein [Vararia minispora EC-137]|uniref:Hydantoinase/oxoprolinase-domain-containing protein n=1 Tax=Vararia minispora EC-137 TaxID=1314806 RepID=A0ACB8QWU7_9AGAM|nr:Hydantoinase/oxoprolinase-domain-containing protein [Vararia minispora EC-137]